MASFIAPDGVEVFYRDEGDGPAVVLLHGLTADGEMNWEWTGIGPAVRDAGFRTLIADARGHGRSSKPTTPAAYHDDRFVDDVSSLLDHVGARHCVLVGYSMGAVIALRTVSVERRVQAVVLGGVDGAENDVGVREAVAAGLEADDPATITHAEARELREFADATGADRAALAALQRGRRTDAYEFDRVRVPALVIAGAQDGLAPRAHALADRLPEGRYVEVPGDHAGALIEPAFRDAIIKFLEGTTGLSETAGPR